MKKLFVAFLVFSFAFGFQAMAAEDLGERLSGKVLVATESDGELWYVNPSNNERHYLGKPADFLGTMRQLAIGVSKKDFDSFKGKAPGRLAGNFLLLVDEGGKIAYVNPDNLKIEKFSNTNEAINGMKKTALGINNANLNRLKVQGNSAVRNTVNNPKEELVAPVKPSFGIGQLTSHQLRSIAERYINDNLMAPGGTASVVDAKPIYGLYELTIELSDQADNVTSYISSDGKIFFPQGLDIVSPLQALPIEEEEDVTNEDENNGLIAQMPVVELFVMSHCPFGTQAEKGILPVLDILGDSIDFELKFVDYVMHGEVEINEQLNQYCIQKEQPEKFIGYLSCFLGEGDSVDCLSRTEIDQDLLEDCTAVTDLEFDVTANYEDRDSWLSGRYPKFNIHQEENEEYGVQGSPTLVINGEKVNSRRDPASLLNVICDSFTTKPDACSVELSPTIPSSGFGFGTTTSNSNLSCG